MILTSYKITYYLKKDIFILSITQATRKLKKISPKTHVSITTTILTVYFLKQEMFLKRII